MRVFTRRHFGRITAATAFAGKRLLARGEPEPDFTIAIPGDWQYLAMSSCGMYNAATTWILNNRNATFELAGGGSVTFNIKGVANVGDCVNATSSADGSTTGAAEIAVASAAYRILDEAGMPYIACAGNHDHNNNPGGRESNVGSHFLPGGIFAPDTRQSVFGAGVPVIGGDAIAYWGGSYNTLSGMNTAMRLAIGERKLLFIGLEFCARSAVLRWAKSVHDAFPDHECWITTHCWLSYTGAPVVRGDGTDPANSLYGPVHYGMANAPASNDTLQAWGGSDATWPASISMSTWKNLQGIVCGHWINPADATGQALGAWYWQRRAAASTSPRGQMVQQLFCNSQELDGGFCVPGPGPNGKAGVGMLMLLHFRSIPGTMEGYAVSVNSSRFMGAPGTAPASAPFFSTQAIQLFSVPMPPLMSRPRLPVSIHPGDRR